MARVRGKKDMTVDPFAEQPLGKAALKKLNPVPENFRLFEAGWLGKSPQDFSVMEVKGAVFRHAKSGPNKGKLVVIVPGTTRSVFVTKDEIRACDGNRKSAEWMPGMGRTTSGAIGQP